MSEGNIEGTTGSLVTEAKDFAFQNGLLRKRSKQDAGVEIISFTLWPSRMQMSSVDLLLRLQKDYNSLIDMVSRNKKLLVDSLQKWVMSCTYSQYQLISHLYTSLHSRPLGVWRRLFAHVTRPPRQWQQILLSLASLNVRHRYIYTCMVQLNSNLKLSTGAQSSKLSCYSRISLVRYRIWHLWLNVGILHESPYESPYEFLREHASAELDTWVRDSLINGFLIHGLKHK